MAHRLRFLGAMPTCPNMRQPPDTTAGAPAALAAALVVAAVLGALGAAGCGERHVGRSNSGTDIIIDAGNGGGGDKDAQEAQDMKDAPDAAGAFTPDAAPGGGGDAAADTIGGMGPDGVGSPSDPQTRTDARTPAAQVCTGLDEAKCGATPGCGVQTCSTCQGIRVATCVALGQPPLACPLVPCAGAACADVTDLQACDARPDCHPVFVDERTCACAQPGCCARFQRCAASERAQCAAIPVACDALTPYCEGPYVVAYTTACYEGCVRAADCTP